MSDIYQDPRIVRPLQNWARRRGAGLLVPKFFFWNSGSMMQRSSIGLLRSLLYQIFEQCPELVPPQ